MGYRLGPQYFTVNSSRGVNPQFTCAYTNKHGFKPRLSLTIFKICVWIELNSTLSDFIIIAQALAPAEPDVALALLVRY